MVAAINWQRPRDAHGHFLPADPNNPKRKKKKATAQTPPIPPINVNVNVNQPPAAPVAPPAAAAPRPLTGLKQKVTMLVDVSGSMGMFRQNVPRSVNDAIDTLKAESQARGIETLFSLALFNTSLQWLQRNVPISQAQRLGEGQYWPGGGTSLRDGLATAINEYRAAPDARDQNVSMLIDVITDGKDENSTQWSTYALRQLIEEVQKTEHWTISMKCPPNHKASIIQEFGLPGDNILEWAQNQAGFAAAQHQTQQAFQGLYAARAAGATRSVAMFANVAAPAVVQANLENVTAQYRQFEVKSGEAGEIADFIRSKGLLYELGRGFYELIKPEKIQARKEVVLYDRQSGILYGGPGAKSMLGLGNITDEVWIKPGDHGRYTVFIQSTSTNRLIGLGSHVLYRL